MATLGTEKSGCCKDVDISVEKWECNMTLVFFQGYNIFILKKMLIKGTKM